MKLAVSSYSFSRFGAGPEPNEKPDYFQLLDRCAAWELDGLELLGVHFAEYAPPAELLRGLRQHAFSVGVPIVAVSAHHNFVNPDPAAREAEIAKLCHWVDVAAELGAGAVRAFGGRWATRPRFAEFMAAQGEEPPLEGYTDADGFAWNAEALCRCADHAGERGVTLVLENHWGFTGTAAGVLRLVELTQSPWLQVVLDTGNFNFRPDQYAEMEALLPHTRMVHAKTYVGGGIYYTADLDYPRIFRSLKHSGFRGYVSLEFEGCAHPDDGIPESLALLRAAWSQA